MRKLIAMFALLIAVPACAQSNPLRQAMAEGVKSMAWKIKTEGISICCCNDSQSWTSRGDNNRVEYTTVIEKLHFRHYWLFLALACALAAGERFRPGARRTAAS